MIIAVDGPAASGKGTVARALSLHYQLPHLDTGLLYRATGLQCLRHGGDPMTEADAVAATGFSDAMMDDLEIRSEAASRAASVVSAHPGVRQALLERQLAFARQPGGAVLDGRDIGTVVVPDAMAKLFVTADMPVRARRRWQELQARGVDAALPQVEAEMAARDAQDAERLAAPLRVAEDAVVLDTTTLDPDAAFARALSIVSSRIARHPPGFA